MLNINFGSAAADPVSTITTGLIVAVGAGIILFLLNWFREWLTAYLKRRSEAEVLAFTLTTMLDKLISDCTDVMDDPRHEDQKTGMYESTVPTPVVQFPETWSWHVFPKKLQYQIRSLPNKIDAANRSIGHVFDYGEGPPFFGDAFEERENLYAWIGLEACLINELLHREYGVTLLDRGEWDPAQSFKERIDKIAKARAESEEWTKTQPSWFMPETTIEEVKERHRKLAADLEAATKRQAGK